MKSKQQRHINTLIATVAIWLVAALSSCGLLYDDLPECETGLRVRFVYDYNMEFANSFHSRVAEVALYVYDSQGRYLSTHQPSRSDLANEDYRFDLPLAPGNYHLVAYSGLACEKASFSFESDPKYLLSSERKVQLRDVSRPGFSHECKENLHPIYYGDLHASVPEPSADGYKPVTLKMMKNTNNFRIMLQQINGKPLSKENFVYEILDDNVRFTSDNNLIPTSTGIKYRPWSKGDVAVGTTTSGVDWVTTYAEFTTSRLVYREGSRVEGDYSDYPGDSQGYATEPRLRIKRIDTGESVLDIPLANYLALYKSDVYQDMPLQEFFDRQSSWDMIFFLDESLSWISTHIQVNGWTVRINEIDI